MPSNTSTETSTAKDDSWQRDIVNRLAFAALNEQRRTRRWRIFFLLLLFIYLFLVYVTALSPNWYEEFLGEVKTTTESKHTALIEVQGLIAPDTEASADKVITGLRNAYKDKETAGIIIRLNSPGGSPVQAGYINDEIVRLRKKHPDIPVYAVATDICASGAYYIAVAADEIYADKASVVGSIGVLMNGFGFVDAMKSLGIERRLLTAGENKGFLDPFSPIKDEDVNHIKGLLKDIHEQFITQVKQGRSKSLTAKKQLELLDNPELFSGLVWTGEQALELGLVDALGSSSYIAREVIKAKKIKDFTYEQNYLDRFAEHLGATITRILLLQFSQSSTNIQ